MRGVQTGGTGGGKGRKYGLNSRGDSFSLGEGVRHQESAFIAKVLLAVKTEPLGPRLGEPARGSAWAPGAPAWLGPGSAPGPAAARGRRRAQLLEPARPVGHAGPSGAHTLPGPGLPRLEALLARRPLPPGLRRGKAAPQEAGLQQPGRL